MDLEENKKMEEKRGESTPKKKRGRPRKNSVNEEERFGNEGSNNANLRRKKCHDRVSLPASVSLDADPEAALTKNSPPVTLVPVKHVLTTDNKSDPNNQISPVGFTSEPPTLSQDLGSCSDKVVEEHNMNPLSCEKANGSMNSNEFATDLLVQKQNPESQMQPAPPSEEEIMLDDYLLEKEANVDSSVATNGQYVPTIVDMSSKLQPESEFVNIEGYKLKKEWEPLLKSIFSKYGDIASNSSFTKESRPCLLELVCSICKRLETSKFTHLTPLELESMKGQIGDLKFVNVEIGWLQKRLNQICTARKLYEGVSAIEDFETRTLLLVDEKKKSVETYEQELEACMETMNELQRKLDEAKDELAATMDVVDQIKIFFNNSLVLGLV